MLPIVSVIGICYNHEKYLERSIQGVLQQESSYTYEYIIHDDASTDSSQEIIKYYARQYPNIIFPILQCRNLYSQGVPLLLNILRYKARGNYIALCECDDYWTDPNKLQLEIDYLESHPNVAGVAHRSIIVDENGNYKCRNFKDNVFIYKKNKLYTLKDFQLGFQPGQTATWVFRKNLVIGNTENEFNRIVSVKSTGDTKISAMLAAQGGIFCIDRVMSCYRLVTTHGTSWNARIQNKNMSLFFYQGNKDIANIVNCLYSKKINLVYINASILLTALFKYLTSRSKDDYIIFNTIWRDISHKIIVFILILVKIVLIFPKYIFRKVMLIIREYS